MAATGPYKPHNGPEPGYTGQSPEVAAKWTEGGPLDRGLYPTANWAEGSQVSRGPLSVAEGGNTSPTGATRTMTGEHVIDETELSQHPFWALLMAAGYEEV